MYSAILFPGQASQTPDMRNLVAGVRRFVETGPGKVLSRLATRTLADAEVLTARRLAATTHA